MDLKEEAPVKYEEKLLKKVRGQRRKNLSTKNVLYSQQLRRYLRTRKEAKEKPLKVRFADDDVKYFKKEVKEPLKVAIKNEDGELERVEVDESVPSVRSGEPAEDIYGSARGSVSSSRKSSSSRSTNGSSVDFSGAEQTPKSSILPRGRGKFEEEKKSATKIKVKQLLDILHEDPEKFGLSRSGGIINPQKGKPFAKSSVERAVERLVSPSVKNAPSPPGTSHLKRLILKDPKAKSFLEETQIGKGAAFKPAKWIK
jgi:hypothetical protein